jgi:NAD(P) transhydrogenase
LYFSGLQQRGLYGIDYSLKENLTIKDFMHRKQIVVRKERVMVRDHVHSHHISVLHGEAALKDAHTVHVKSDKGEQEITGEIILIATGSSPHRPPEIPFDDERICDSDSILDLKFIPKAMVVVGGTWHPCHADRDAGPDRSLR